MEDKNPKSKPKPSHWGSVSVDKMWGVLEFCRWDGNGVEYAVVRGLGGRERARHEGGRYSAKNQKLSHWGSVSVNETRGVLDFG